MSEEVNRMNAKRMFLFVGVAIVTATATVASVDKTAAEKIASARLADAGVTAQVGAGYAGAKRYTFKFEGYKAYFDEPVAAKPGRRLSAARRLREATMFTSGRRRTRATSSLRTARAN
jgi:hypothetical protein